MVILVPVSTDAGTALVLLFMYDFDRSTMHNYSTVGGDEGCRVGEVLPSSLTISVLSYSNCQSSTHFISK